MNSRWRQQYRTCVDWPNLHLKGHPPQDRYACFKQKPSNQAINKAATVNEGPKSHLTVVNRFSDKAKLSATLPENPTFSTESADFCLP
ncbi:hypothetical protein HNO86_17720 [Pseudomonas sp. C1C7]|uniref:hypothetical protein n=1 Tax=Pseudomonas sp. C1C7 TaxID=2735272 RepID=UPI001586F4AE|nr:hypothetical protein [Pseudomonas sp. C1C7]NUT76882.1 hypothetical protein [Pseudomonas sp. C1C7]